MRKIFIDIETIPGENKIEEDKISAPANYKDPVKIAAYIEEKVGELYLKQSLDPLLGEILCIGIAIDDNPVDVIMKGTTKDNILALRDYLKNAMPDKELIIAEWIGHNIAKFDVPFIGLNILKYVKEFAHLFPTNSKDRSIVDLADLCSFGVYGQYVSFDKACKFFLNDSPKHELDGSKVYQYYLEGRLQEIAEYCADDVEYSRRLYNVAHPNANRNIKDSQNEEVSSDINL